MTFPKTWVDGEVWNGAAVTDLENRVVAAAALVGTANTFTAKQVFKPGTAGTAAIEVKDPTGDIAYSVDNNSKIYIGSTIHQGLIAFRGNGANVGLSTYGGVQWMSGIDDANLAAPLQDFAQLVRIKEDGTGGDDYIYTEYNDTGAPRTTFGFVDHNTVHGAYEFVSWANTNQSAGQQSYCASWATIAIRTQHAIQTGPALAVWDTEGQTFQVDSRGNMQGQSTTIGQPWHIDAQSMGNFGCAFTSNAKMTGEFAATWDITGSYGSRLIILDRLYGIRFCADNAAGTAGTAFTPTEVFRLQNDGALLHKGAPTTAKVGFWQAAGTTQPVQHALTTGFTAGAGSAVLVDSTFTGNTGSRAYTIGDIVAALKQVGLIAS